MIGNPKPWDERAFPTGVSNGMTLRDYFAGKALAASQWTEWDREDKDSVIAERCYQIADRMLRERRKGGE